jgi:Cu(I)-responsive transcriptional regulator
LRVAAVPGRKNGLSANPAQPARGEDLFRTGMESTPVDPPAAGGCIKDFHRPDLRAEQESQNMNIGEASKATGISVKMLRYYEEIGLVRPALRTYSGYRVYSGKDVATLRFIRRARDLGFQVKQIASLLDLWQDGSRSSADVKALALGHVAELERRRREIDEMIATLEHLARHCHGNDRPDCPILTSLGADEDPAPAAKPGKRARKGFAVA